MTDQTTAKIHSLPEIRTVTVEAAQLLDLRRLSAQEGRPVHALVREAISLLLEQRKA